MTLFPIICMLRKMVCVSMIVVCALSIRAVAEMPILTDVRAEGMGTAYTAVAHQSTALDWNPAGLGDMRRSDLTALFSQGFVDTKFTSISYGRPTDFGGWALGWGRVSNEFEKTNAQDDFLGNGAVSNDVVMAGFGYYRLPVSLGLSVRYFSEKIDPVQLSGYAFDVGALYEYKKLRLGWAWKNILSNSLEGTGMAGDNVSEVIPPLMRAGAALTLPLDFDIQFLSGASVDPTINPEIWHCTLITAADVEIPVYRNQSLAVSPGLEVGVNDLISFRAGLKQCKDFSVGMSIKASAVSFDYAFVFNPSITNTHILSLSIYFGA
ncbi:MAG: UPF0164 family protein [Elusimicrobia bacterium]|nr:UPF0164 family protein [Elusimicrobiota bacterium]